MVHSPRTMERQKGLRGPSAYFFLCLLALRRLRYLCLDIFLRLFLINEPMQTPLSKVISRTKGNRSMMWLGAGAHRKERLGTT